MFILTFHDEAEKNDGHSEVGTQDPNQRAPYIKIKADLKKMTGMSRQEQLILFMTGAGGSGKTRVINANCLPGPSNTGFRSCFSPSSILHYSSFPTPLPMYRLP
jgi:hypothetical protein